MKNVILYGSYARGDYKKGKEISDIDIMILIDTDNQEELCDIQNKVLDYSYDWNLKYNILLSPFVESVENYDDRVKYIAFYKNIAREGVSLNG